MISSSPENAESKALRIWTSVQPKPRAGTIPDSGWGALLDREVAANGPGWIAALGGAGPVFGMALSRGHTIPSGLGRGPLWDLAASIRAPGTGPGFRAVLAQVPGAFDLCLLALEPDARLWVAAAEMQRVAQLAPGAPASEVVEALSQGMLALQRIGRRTAVRAAVLTLRGRGRFAGPVNADLLFRFGVSDWR